MFAHLEIKKTNTGQKMNKLILTKPFFVITPLEGVHINLSFSSRVVHDVSAKLIHHARADRGSNNVDFFNEE
jgi:hypothetical protein